MKLTGCPKGKWPFRFHDWEYESDIEVWGEDHWLHNVLMAHKGNNMVETNERYVCQKCGKIELE